MSLVRADPIKNLKNVVEDKMDKKESQELTIDILLADCLIRLSTIEKLLISKNVFSQEEFAKAMHEISSKITKSILEKANVPGDLDKIVENLHHKS